MNGLPSLGLTDYLQAGNPLSLVFATHNRIAVFFLPPILETNSGPRGGIQWIQFDWEMLAGLKPGPTRRVARFRKRALELHGAYFNSHVSVSNSNNLSRENWGAGGTER